MPLEDDPRYRGTIDTDRALQLQEPEQKRKVTLSEQMGAAFDLDNTVASAVNALNQPTRAPEEDFDPMAHLAPGEDLISRHFATAKSVDEMEDIRKQLDRERNARRMLGEGPLNEFLASAIATVVDPTTFLPVVGAAGKLKTAERIGAVALGSAADVALSEGILQSTQQNRPIDETVAAIIMGGAFGAGIGGAIARHQRAYERSVEDFRAIYRGAADQLGTPVARPESAGAAAVQRYNPEDTILAGGKVVRGIASGLAKLKGFVAPGLELAASPFAASRQSALALVDSGLVTEGHLRGVANAVPVDLQIRQGQNVGIKYAADVLVDNYKAYRSAGGTLDRVAFHERVGKAMRRNDIDEGGDAAVSAAAKKLRNVFDQLKDAAVAAKLLPADVKMEEALSYFTRVYDTQKIKAREPEFKARVVNYLRRNTSKEDLNMVGGDEFLSDTADDIIHTIMGAPRGRVPYHLQPKVRGPLKERTFHIPDAEIEDFLVNDALEVAQKYVNTMVADISMANLSMRLGFGGRPDDVATGLSKQIREEATRLSAAAKTEKDRLKIANRAEREEALVDALVNLIRGTDRGASDPGYDGLRRLARSTRTVTYMTKLGSVVLSSIPDMARIVMEEGLNRTVGTLLQDMGNGFKATKVGRKEAQTAGTALEMFMSTRVRSIYDLGERYSRETKLERAIDTAGQWYGNITLLNPYNEATKSFSSVLVSTRILQTAEKLAKGQELTAREVRKLAASGISQDMALRMAGEAEHWDRHGYAVLANIREWKDKEAARTFRQALMRDVDNIIITPGRGDAPIWTSTEWGKTIFQFKKFGSSTTQRILLAGLQNRDVETLNGALMMVGLGGVATYLTDIAAQGEVKDRTTGSWVNEALNRSGLLSMAYEMDSIMDKASGGNISLQRAVAGDSASKFKSRDLLGQLAGPTAGTVSGVMKAAIAAGEGDFTQADLHAIRSTMPGQNHFLFRGLLTKLEKSSGLPEKQSRKKVDNSPNLP